MDNKALIRRLSLPKFLFREARAALQRPGPYSGGMATSLLQDSVEAFLRIVAEHKGVGVTVADTFLKLFGEVSCKCTHVEGHRVGISRLNKARVAFKHHGVCIVHEDAQFHSTTANAFLTDISRQVLDVDFESVSLVSAIGHQRTKNWLHKAEKSVNDGNYRASLEYAATAFAIYNNYSSHYLKQPTLYSPIFRPSELQLESPKSKEFVRQFMQWVDEEFKQVHEQIGLLTQGVDLFSYRKFQSLTPSVSLLPTGTIAHVQWGGWGKQSDGFSKKDAAFCIDFVVDSVLQISDKLLPEQSHLPGRTTQTAIVEHNCAVIVYPEEDSEIIREASAGEKLVVVESGLNKKKGSEYVAVLQDGKRAYVSKDWVCVK